jgi:hypothetical protein
VYCAWDALFESRPTLSCKKPYQLSLLSGDFKNSNSSGRVASFS